ncbi:Pectinesterase [Handroanthus impetiginosus]|uniref:Pectinesterase n=1 Tax=Handroanthus impetiginosus TaxID=429701 RepID=A0A2G9H2N2_9LAMI|nr:Pectinesterase [Handroanthus impetiginosus]
MAIVLFICTAFFICFAFTNGEFDCTSGLIDRPTLAVDPLSNTSFSSIQSAIDSVPSNNKKWISICVKAGVYNEQVKIPPDKPYIYLKGEGIGKTNVVWDGHDTMLTSSTFASLADNIVVSGITFVNSYNYPPSKNDNPVKPAVATKISGDKSAFYECSFLGYQDTLLDDEGRHYFKLCNIEGAIDFIFGGGQSIYEKCTISVNAGIKSPYSIGFIAAQARASRDDTGGFVFKQCNVTGEGKAFLGRAWKPYSRVIYFNSFLSNVVIPQGWDAWTYADHESQLTFVEEECQGSGSDKFNRVKWEKNLSTEELHSFTRFSYIDNEGWIRKIPLKIQD